MLSQALGRRLTPEEGFSVQALTADPLLFSTDIAKHSTPSEAVAGPPEGWQDRQPTDRESRAVTVLQAGFKGLLTREVLRAARAGTKDNLTASQTLADMWPSVESDAVKHSSILLCFILAHPGTSAGLYPCQQDESARMTCCDYTVPLLQETPDEWVLVFREVFLVPKDMLVSARVLSPVPCCQLRVFNNDTGEELPRIVGKVVPSVYQPNKLGYTFLVEAYTPQPPLAGAKADHVATVHFRPSKPDVQLRLSVLDHEVEVAGASGKGHAVIPLFTFRADEATPPAGPQAQNAAAHQNKTAGKEEEEEAAAEEEAESSAGQKEKEKMKKERRKGEPADCSQGGEPADRPSQQTPSETTTHKYIVQVEVLYKSWTLDDSQLAFVQTLRNLENEARAVEDEAIRSSSTETASSDGPKPATPKTPHKRKGDKEKLVSKPGSRQDSLGMAVDTVALRVTSPERGPEEERRREQPVLWDAAVEEEQRRERLEQIQIYRLQRDTVLEHRRQEAQSRRALVHQQLEAYNTMQLGVQQQRQKLLSALRAAVGEKAVEEEQAQEGAVTATAAASSVAVQPAKPNKSAAGKRK
ncbi:hypothetical protein CRUP_015781 [Coryphaenoides rupestris]|nr:hypothetical protein CRUP_015781 [Coryphaenoides rupestris]